MQSFIFDPSKGETPASLARKRKIAEALAGNVGTPRNVGEGLTAVGNAIAYRMMMNEASRGERAGRESARGPLASIAAALSPGSFPPAPAAPSTPTAAGAALGSFRAAQEAAPSGMDAYRNAIASIESAGSGDYAAVGPTHPELGRALGKYQVMEANIGPWSKKHLGREITADEFMANPKLQDAIFDGEFGSYVQQYGPEGAAQAWFGGPGGVGKVNRQDSLGTSIGEYTDKFSSALGPQVASADPAIGIAQALNQGQPSQPSQAPSPGVRRVAQAMPQQLPEMAGNTRPIPQGGPDLQMLMGMAQNPWVMEQYGGIVEALMKQRMDAMQQANDPMRRMELERAQIELEQLRNPPSEFGFMELPDGTVIRTDPRSGQAAEAFKGQPKTPETPSEVREYNFYVEQERAAGREPASYNDWRLQGKKAGATSIDIDNGMKLTEGQSKDVGFFTRGLYANDELSSIEQQLTSLPGFVAGQLGVPGNYYKDPEYRQAERAGRELLAVILRKDTGAAVTQQEFDLYGPMYLPWPGDDAGTVTAKREARERAIGAIELGLGTATPLAKEVRTKFDAEREAKKRAAPPTQDKPISEMTDEELEAIINGQ